MSVSPRIKTRIKIGLGLSIAVASTALFFSLKLRRSQNEPALSPAPPPEAEASTPTPLLQPLFPVPQTTTSEKKVQASKTLNGRLRDLFGSIAFDSLFNKDDVIRRFVGVIDSAESRIEPREESSPLQFPDSEFIAEEFGAKITISPANYERYLPYVNLIRSIDAQKLTELYVDFYHQLQAAHRELGSNRYFNDRLIEAIDELLRTPVTVGPIELTRHENKRLYIFTDDQLEELTALQKILIRMGPANSNVVRKKLVEIRQKLIHL